MKKVLSIVLSLAMLISITAGLDLSAFASTYSGICGTKLTWSLNTSTGELNISGEGKMKEYIVNGENEPWYSYSSYVKEVNIGDGVTYISQFVFGNCSNLTSVNIPSSVTSIGRYAFSGTKLTSVTIPEGIISIGDYAFAYCSSLTSITIPNSVTSIGDYPFSGCSGLTSITVDEDNTFYDSRENCNAIIETETNTLMCGCKNTVIPNGVTSIGGYAFRGTKLTSVTIPEGVISIGDYAFSDTKLTSVTIPEGVISIGDGAFDSCTGLSSIVVDENNAVYDSRENCNAIIETATNTLICGCNNTVIPNGVKSIGKGAFYGYKNLKSISIPESVTSIGISAFGYCSGLANITIPASVTSIGDGAFNFCTSLANITIPASVLSIGDYAFNECYNLSRINILNPNCEIYEEYSLYPGAVIYGYGNSTALEYAQQYDREFILYKESYDCDAGNHMYKFTERIEPTCTDQGYNTYICKTCGYSYNESIEPQHQLESIKESDHCSYKRCTRTADVEISPRFGSNSYSYSEEHDFTYTFSYSNAKSITIMLKKTYYVGTQPYADISIYDSQGNCVASFPSTELNYSQTYAVDVPDSSFTIKFTSPSGVFNESDYVLSAMAYTCDYYEESGTHNFKTITYIDDCTAYESIIVKHSCQDCGYSYFETVTPQAKHNYTVEKVLYDCTEGGTATYSCVNCKYSYTVEIEPQDHIYSEGLCTECGSAELDVDNMPYFEIGETKSVYCSDLSNSTRAYKFAIQNDGEYTFKAINAGYMGQAVATLDLETILEPISCTDNSYTYYFEGGKEYVTLFSFNDGGEYLVKLRDNSQPEYTAEELGGSIRLSDNGLRFGFSYDETQGAEVEEYGFVYAYSVTDDLTVDGVGTNGVKQRVASNRINHGDYTTFNLVFTNIPQSGFDTVVSARAYVKIDGEYYYSDVLQRSFSQVANAVLADDEIDEETKNTIREILGEEA